MHVCDEGGIFSSDNWEPIYGIMTNLGLFRYDRVHPLENLPKIMRLHMLKVTEIKGVYKGKRNVFKLDYINDKEKMSEKYFFVDDAELYPVWVAKLRQTIKEYKELGNKILQPPSERQADIVEAMGATGMQQDLSASNRLSMVIKKPISRLKTKMKL